MDEHEAEYLHRLGERLRLARTRRGMTMRALARESGVSLRFIAQTEAGQGNPSVLRLRQLAEALGASPVDFVADRSPALGRLDSVIAGLDAAQKEEAADLLATRYAAGGVPGRAHRIALIGLRGAGKSTLGRLLARARHLPFHELDADVERLAGTGLAAIFELHGQAGYRRFERMALERLIKGPRGAVIATGGGIVASEATYERLLAAFRTIWIRARPETHMARVTEQGDLRPMRYVDDAMADLRAILEARAPLYARAEFQIDTTGRTPAECIAVIQSLLAGTTG